MAVIVGAIVAAMLLVCLVGAGFLLVAGTARTDGGGGPTPVPPPTPAPSIRPT